MRLNEHAHAVWSIIRNATWKLTENSTHVDGATYHEIVSLPGMIHIVARAGRQGALKLISNDEANPIPVSLSHPLPMKDRQGTGQLHNSLRHGFASRNGGPSHPSLRTTRHDQYSTTMLVVHNEQIKNCLQFRLTQDRET